MDIEKYNIPKNNIIDGSIYLPNVGYIGDTNLATHQLFSTAKINGCHFEFGKEIIDITQNNGRVTGLVLDNNESIKSSIVVNVAGYYSNIINKMAFPNNINTITNDMTLTTRPLIQEQVYVPFLPKTNYDKNGPITIDFDLGMYSIPQIGNKILIDRNKPHYLDYKTNMKPNSLQTPNVSIPSRQKINKMVSCYDATEDWTPIYDKSSLDGYYMAIGTCGNQ